MPNERVKDYLKNPKYEKRIVAFCDVLGWRSQIAKAGSEAEKIGELRRQILLVERMIAQFKPKIGLRFSSFSDNIVLSGPVKERAMDAMIIALNDYQVTSAVSGFMTRGGITIGEVCHDSQAVFGPALNRAYELESTVAKYPRIVLDRKAFRGKRYYSAKFFTDADKDCLFLNPFAVKSIAVYGGNEPGDGFWDGLGLPKFRDEPYPPVQVLRHVLGGIRLNLRSPLSNKDYKRIAWLHDRVARELGVSLSAAYPRIRPTKLIPKRRRV
jgi:hypothetical protein